MGFNRIGRPTLRTVFRIQPDMDQKGIGRVTQHLKITELGHMAVVIDPATGDAGQMKTQGIAFGPGRGARIETVLLRPDSLADAPIIGLERMKDADKVVVTDPL